MPRRGRRPGSTVTAGGAGGSAGAGGPHPGHYPQHQPVPSLGLDVHPGVYHHQSQLMGSGAPPENGLLPPPPPPPHPQHMAAPHIDVSSGMMQHLGGMPVSQSRPLAYMDSSAMMISPGPPPPVATMVTMPSSHHGDHPMDTDSYSHLQQQQHELQLRQHNEEQQQLAAAAAATAPMMNVAPSNNDGSGLGPVSGEGGSLAPPMVIPQHVLTAAQDPRAAPESVTPRPASPETATLPPPEQHPSAEVQPAEPAGVVNSHASSPYQPLAENNAPVLHPAAHTTQDADAPGSRTQTHQNAPSLHPEMTSSQLPEAGDAAAVSSALPSEGYEPSPVQEQDMEPGADTTSKESASLIDAQATMKSADASSDHRQITRMSTSPNNEH